MVSTEVLLDACGTQPCLSTRLSREPNLWLVTEGLGLEGLQDVTNTRNRSGAILSEVLHFMENFV